MIKRAEYENYVLLQVYDNETYLFTYWVPYGGIAEAYENDNIQSTNGKEVN
jgi:hypothetical protein